MTDWAKLPALVIEKIIRYAVFGEYEEVKNDYLMNYWALCVHDYSRVCRNWRSVIFSSKKLFLSSEAEQHAIVYDDGCRKTEADAKMLIEEGFLTMAKKVYIDNSRAARFIRHYALDNSLEQFDVTTSNWTNDDFDQLIHVISLSRWATTFTIQMSIDSNEAVTSFWKLLLAMINGNQRANKTINLQLSCTIDPDWHFNASFDVIDGQEMMSTVKELTICPYGSSRLSSGPDWSAITKSVIIEKACVVVGQPDDLAFAVMDAKTTRIDISPCFVHRLGDSWNWSRLDQCQRLVIRGDCEQLARVAKVIKHSNAHFIIAEAFVTADTLFEAVSHLTSLVDSLPASSIKTLTYPGPDEACYPMLPIPEITFTCDEHLSNAIRATLFEKTKVILASFVSNREMILLD